MEKPEGLGYSVLWGIGAWGLFYALVLAYCGAVVTGKIDVARRLGATELALVGLAAVVALLLLSPGLLNKVELFKVGQFQLRLHRLQNDLNDLRLMLALILPEIDRGILVDASRGQCRRKGDDDVKAALRRLRGQKLLERANNRTVAEMADKETVYNVLEYVGITALGQEVGQLIQKANERPPR